MVPVVPRAAAVTGFPLPLSFTPCGFFFGFFGFDFLAEFFVFGVFGFAAFAFFVVDFFDRYRPIFAFVGFAVVGFGFGFACFDDEGQAGGRYRRDRGMRRSGGGEQHQRGEEQCKENRELPHDSLIGPMRRAP